MQKSQKKKKIKKKKKKGTVCVITSDILAARSANVVNGTKA